MKLFSVLILSLACLGSQAIAQEVIIPTITLQQPTTEVAIGRSAFHKSAVRAARELRKKGEITRAQEVQFRVAMFSPAFRKHCEDVSVTQMVFSGSDAIPMSADGVVERGRIDWEGFAAFLEKMIPVFLMILKAIQGMS